jgi:hypothetical protein
MIMDRRVFLSVSRIPVSEYDPEISHRLFQKFASKSDEIQIYVRTSPFSP